MDVLVSICNFIMQCIFVCITHSCIGIDDDDDDGDGGDDDLAKSSINESVCKNAFS